MLSNTEQVLKAEGAEIPEGVHVVEERKPSTVEEIYLYLPPVNQSITLEEEEMKKAADARLIGLCDRGSGS